MIRDIIFFIYTLGLTLILCYMVYYTDLPESTTVTAGTTFFISLPIALGLLVLPEIIKPKSELAKFLTKKII